MAVRYGDYLAVLGYFVANIALFVSGIARVLAGWGLNGCFVKIGVEVAGFSFRRFRRR